MTRDNFWKDKRVLVTGATGLVGSHLTESLLQSNAQVSALVLNIQANSIFLENDNLDKINCYYGDLGNKRDTDQIISEFDPEIIFHLGAQTIVGNALKNPVETFESNIQGTWNLLESARILGSNVQSIVVASSDKAYGAAQELPYSEVHPLHGDGPYDVSKSCTDLIAQSYAYSYGLPITIARCGNIYGPGDLNWSRIVPGTFKDLFLSKTPKLRSNGLNLRDYIYVADVVAAYETLAKSASRVKPGEAFNFSNDLAYSVLEVYEEICLAALGKYVEPSFEFTASKEIQDQHLTSKKAFLELNWQAEYSLKLGLEKTGAWYKKRIIGGSPNE